MKRLQNTSLLSLLLVLSFLNVSYGQETIIITLYVNTSAITNTNEYQVSYFEGQGEGTDTRDFTVYVNPGDQIIWQGVSENAPETDVVSIKSINYEGGRNVFDRNVLKGNGAFPEQVSALVMGGTRGFEQKYKISFNVFNNGQKRQGTYHIDPKIKVK